MPDLDLVTDNGPLRVFTLLHDARPVLLNLGEPGGFDITPWAIGSELIDANTPACGSFRSLGDGHRSHRRVDPARRTCRLGGDRQAPLGLMSGRLTTWFGPPTAA